MIPIDASEDLSCAIVSVLDLYLVEICSLAVDMEGSLCIIWNIGEAYLEGGVVDSSILATDFKVVKRTVNEDVSGYCY